MYARANWHWHQSEIKMTIKPNELYQTLSLSTVSFWLTSLRYDHQASRNEMKAFAAVISELAASPQSKSKLKVSLL